MNNVVKALDVKSLAFPYLCGKFLRLTFDKAKARVFIRARKSDSVVKTSNLKQC
jgi:hypothetical protein